MLAVLVDGDLQASLGERKRRQGHRGSVSSHFLASLAQSGSWVQQRSIAPQQLRYQAVAAALDSDGLERGSSRQ
jgi:hypothetical protein